MGIKVREMLALEYFSDFGVIAGEQGLDRQIQGVTAYEAPDCFRWMQGRELILSSGYVLSHEPQSIYDCFDSGKAQQMTGMVIKQGRYLDQIPAEMIAKFDAFDIPLILAPVSAAWMDMMHQINVAVLNRNIRGFSISELSSTDISDATYKERKISCILRVVEREMAFSAFLYDISAAKLYTSSPQMAKSFPMTAFKLEDFWEPSFGFSRQPLCDGLKLARYRCEDRRKDWPPISWIVAPIRLGDVVKAYFVVIEQEDKIDYSDEFALRTAMLLLYSVYEQIAIAESRNNMGFESFMGFVLRSGSSDPLELARQAQACNLDPNQKYNYALLCQTEQALNFMDKRGLMRALLRRVCANEDCRFAFLDKNQCLLMFKSGGGRSCQQRGQELQAALARLLEELSREMAGAAFCCGLLEQDHTLYDAARALSRCRQAANIGPYLYPDRNIWRYCELGAFAWMQVQEDERAMLFGEYLPVLCDPRNAELTRTLRIYLENNMNFSLTAEKLYLHINTVRKRIEKLQDMIYIDWTDSAARMKIELMLRLLIPDSQD